MCQYRFVRSLYRPTTSKIKSRLVQQLVQFSPSLNSGLNMLISLHSSFFPDNFCRSKQTFLDLIFDLSFRTRVKAALRKTKLTSLTANLFRTRPLGELSLCLRWFVLHRVYRGKRIWLISSLDIDFSPIKLYIFLIRTTS